MENQQATSGNGVIGRIRSLFDTDKNKDVVITPSSDNRREGETYMMWGKRVCGHVDGRLQTLPPYLHKVYNDIYHVLASDAEAQRVAKAQIEVEIEQKNNEKRAIHNSIDNINSQINRIRSKEEDLKEERGEIKKKKEEVNKEQLLKLKIGLIIIAILTFYLFLFYSSTFYSAFFRDPSSMGDGLYKIMFDPQALANAYADGLAELGFVGSAPVIFMGLGFVLHFFSIQKNKVKYLKMAAILLVTVMFDCILAYKIGEQMHSYGCMTGLYPIGEEYTVKMSIYDINTWAVIFCGFIVYVIWGILFDMCMSAYEKLDLNKTRLESIKVALNDCEKKIHEKITELQTLRHQETDIDNSISLLTSKLGQTILIDYARIKTEMNNFFAGWITMMQVLSISQDNQDEANVIYQREIASLLKK